MKYLHEMSIHEIEHLPESTASAAALESLTIKGHRVYLVDLEGFYKFSALVYFDGAPISHANMYGLHHPDPDRGSLRTYYIRALERKLYTDADLTAPLKDYEDYKRRNEYLVNLYSQRIPYVSAFYIGNNAPDTSDMIFDPVTYAFYLQSDQAFVKQHVALNLAVDRLWLAALKDDEQIMTQAFEHEMWNHEYSINWEGDADVLAALGFRKFSDLNQMQRRAYHNARSAYLARCGEC